MLEKEWRLRRGRKKRAEIEGKLGAEKTTEKHMKDTSSVLVFYLLEPIFDQNSVLSIPK
jgi:hypothetical protein